jgi:hypothetical protein
VWPGQQEASCVSELAFLAALRRLRPLAVLAKPQAVEKTHCRLHAALVFLSQPVERMVLATPETNSNRQASKASRRL